MKVQGIVKFIGDKIKEAEKDIIEQIKNGEIEQETSVTDRFLAEIRKLLNEQEKNGIKIRVRTLKDHGPKTAEYKYGADFCCVLGISIKDYKTIKGFLCQAKPEKSGINILKGHFGLPIGVKITHKKDLDDLKVQSDKMLSITPDSFAIIYSIKGFIVVPALSIKGIQSLNIEIYGVPVVNFFKAFVMCFIGDHNLKAYDDNTLEQLRGKTFSRSAIIFELSNNYSSIKGKDKFA